MARLAFSTVLGILLLVPVIVNFKDFSVRRSGGMPVRLFLTGTIMFTLFITTVLTVFSEGAQDRFGAVAPTLAYLPMPFLVLASMSWGPRGGSVAALVGAMVVVWLTANGKGPFVISEGFAGESVIEVQAYVSIWAALLLVGQALDSDRRAALIMAREWQLRYERTLVANGVASVEFDAVSGAAVWGDSADTVLGPEVGQIRNISDWLDIVNLADRALVRAEWDAMISGRRNASAASYDIHLDDRDLQVQTRLAPVRGPDGSVERVACLLQTVSPANMVTNYA